MKVFLSLLLGLTLGIGIFGGLETYRSYERIYTQCKITAYDRQIAQLQLMLDVVERQQDYDWYDKEIQKIDNNLIDDLKKCEAYNGYIKY